MRTGINKIDGIRRDFSVDCSQIAGDIDATASFERVMERVIIEQWMRGVLSEKPDAFIRLSLFRRPHLRVPLTEVAMKLYYHGRW